jgi:ATP:ADP antiporter, AAA family
VRLLGLVTSVRRSEVPTALLLTLDAFLLLTAYGCIKPAREALILALPTGAEYKIYMSAAIAAVLLIAVPLYARFAAKLTRNRLVIGVTLFFASHLMAFYLLAPAYRSTVPLALGFYLWIGIFDLMVVAQFWAFANDIYSEEAGQRLFPLLGLGASVGAVAGSALARVLIASVGTMATLLVAAVLLVITAVITQVVHVREVGRTVGARADPVGLARTGERPGGAFRMVFRDRYLALIAVLSLVFALVKSNGEYILAKLVADAARQAVGQGHAVGDYIAGFYASFLFYVDLLSLVLQALVVSRLVKYLGFGPAFLLLPVVAFCDAGAIVLWPLLLVAQVGKLAENATAYSVFNTVRNMLWLPTARPAKYLAKQAVDTFFVRMGGVLSAVAVFAGAQLMGWPVRNFAVWNVVLVALWLVVARAILRERAMGTPSQRSSSLSAGRPPC